MIDIGAGPGGTDLIYNVFHNSFLDSDVIFYASKDFQELEQDGVGMSDEEKYYKVNVSVPVDYVYDPDDVSSFSLQHHLACLCGRNGWGFC